MKFPLQCFSKYPPVPLGCSRGPIPSSVGSGVVTDVVVGERAAQRPLKRLVLTNIKLAAFPDHCLMRAVVLEVKDVVALEEIRTILDVGGYGENPVYYLGGLMCMVVFNEKRLAVDFIENEVST
ncbi:hypothetical protein HanRHA438_Chr16g0735921 [Helianthus annuus]|nr:hypothetical protein HanRHA438_Chr16g0735921 [Helianthus annuus]